MVKPFYFASTPHLVFGSGKRSGLTARIRPFGSRIVLLTGARSFTSTSVWPAVQAQLEEGGISWRHHIIDGEPTPEMIDNIALLHSAKDINAVVAIGGGSVLDAGKAIAAMVGKGEPVKVYLEDVGTKEPDGSTLPFIALPTTSGTGSECTKNAVISQVGKNGFKKSLRHDHFIPKAAIVDPELTLNCPPEITAASGMDAFTQLLESYVSDKASPVTNVLALSGLEAISNNFEKVMANGNDLPAREGLAYAAMLSGITLANAGLGTVHGFASSVGGRYHIPHGVVCGTLMGECNRLTVKKIRSTGAGAYALPRYAAAGQMFCKKEGESQDYYIDFLLDIIAQWTERFAIPKLSAYGVESVDFNSITADTGNKNNPVKLEKEELMEVLENRL